MREEGCPNQAGVTSDLSWHLSNTDHITDPCLAGGTAALQLIYTGIYQILITDIVKITVTVTVTVTHKDMIGSSCKSSLCFQCHSFAKIFKILQKLVCLENQLVFTPQLTFTKLFLKHQLEYLPRCPFGVCKLNRINLSLFSVCTVRSRPLLQYTLPYNHHHRKRLLQHC